MLKESVAKFAKEQIGPKVKEMDEKELLDKSILQQLFDQGVMFFDPAYGYWNKDRIWRRRVLLHVCYFGCGGYVDLT